MLYLRPNVVYITCVPALPPDQEPSLRVQDLGNQARRCVSLRLHVAADQHCLLCGALAGSELLRQAEGSLSASITSGLIDQSQLRVRPKLNTRDLERERHSCRRCKTRPPHGRNIIILSPDSFYDIMQERGSNAGEIDSFVLNIQF